jgi:hypothetical protein
MAYNSLQRTGGLVQTGGRLSFSTFGAIGDEPKGRALCSTFERSAQGLAIWVATRIPFVPYGLYGFGRIFIFLNLYNKNRIVFLQGGEKC